MANEQNDAGPHNLVSPEVGGDESLPLGATSFSNEPLRVDTLPQLGDDNFEPVDPNYLKMSLLTMALAGVVLLVVVGGIIIFSGWHWALGLAAVGGVALLVLAAVFRSIEVRTMGFQLRDHDVSYRRGVIVRKVSTVPYTRVQHARLRQGPVDRWFNIGAVEVNSAGPDLNISGLPYDQAERVLAFVLSRAGDPVDPDE